MFYFIIIPFWLSSYFPYFFPLFTLFKILRNCISNTKIANNIFIFKRRQITAHTITLHGTLHVTNSIYSVSRLSSSRTQQLYRTESLHQPIHPLSTAVLSDPIKEIGYKMILHNLVLQMLRTSYSYLALLRQIHEKQNFQLFSRIDSCECKIITMNQVLWHQTQQSHSVSQFCTFIGHIYCILRLLINKLN